SLWPKTTISTTSACGFTDRFCKRGCALASLACKNVHRKFPLANRASGEPCSLRSHGHDHTVPPKPSGALTPFATRSPAARSRLVSLAVRLAALRAALRSHLRPSSARRACSPEPRLASLAETPGTATAPHPHRRGGGRGEGGGLDRRDHSAQSGSARGGLKISTPRTILSPRFSTPWRSSPGIE